jgi:hypothetical protein
MDIGIRQHLLYVCHVRYSAIQEVEMVPNVTAILQRFTTEWSRAKAS